MIATEESISISFDGLEKLSQDIEKVERIAPDYMRKAVEKAGRKFRKEVHDLTKSKLKYRTKPPTGNLLKGFRSKTVLKYGSLRSFEAQEFGGFGKARHFHLVENGHVRTAQVFYRTNGEGKKFFYKSSAGFTPGIHTMEQTKKNWRSGERLIPYAEEAIKKALEGGNFK